MARIRNIKPDFFMSDDVSELDYRTRLTWIGLWTHADDHGRLKDNPRAIKGAVWSLDDSVAVREVEADLGMLARRGRIVRYQADGQRYLAIVNWHRHQRPNRPSPSKIPAPTVPIGVPEPEQDGHCAACWGQEQLTERSLSAHAQLSDSDQESLQVNASDSNSVSPHEPVTEDSLSEGEGERGMEGGGEAREPAPEPPAPRTPTRPRCPRHAHLADDDPGPNCVACRDARLGASQTTANAERDEAATRRACRLCDADGWRWLDPKRRGNGPMTGPGARCDHKPIPVGVP